jgi:hypothetical protein
MGNSRQWTLQEMKNKKKKRKTATHSAAAASSTLQADACGEATTTQQVPLDPPQNRTQNPLIQPLTSFNFNSIKQSPLN